MNVRGEVCSRLPSVLLIVLNTPVMKVPNTSYFNIINLGIINIILIKMLHCMALMMLLLIQCREFGVRLTLITMKLKLNLSKKLTNEDKHVITIIADLIGCMLFVDDLYYGIYWCFKVLGIISIIK